MPTVYEGRCSSGSTSKVLLAVSYYWRCAEGNRSTRQIDPVGLLIASRNRRVCTADELRLNLVGLD